MRVHAEAVYCPNHRCGGGFVPGGEEGHHLVDEVLVCEAAGAEGDGDDVDTGFFVFGTELAFLVLDELTADLADGLRRGWDLLVACYGDGLDDPHGQEQAGETEELGLSAWLKDLAVCGIQLGGWIFDGSEIVAHAGGADDV